MSDNKLERLSNYLDKLIEAGIIEHLLETELYFYFKTNDLFTIMYLTQAGYKVAYKERLKAQGNNHVQVLKPSIDKN